MSVSAIPGTSAYQQPQSKGNKTKEGDPIWEKVRKTIVEELGVPEAKVIPTARFVEDLDADWVTMYQLVSDLEQEFHLDASEADVKKFITVKDLVDYIKSPRSFMAEHPSSEHRRNPYPTDVMYSQDHEWVKVDGKNVSIGITDDAQESLGDIVFVTLPKIGTEIAVGEPFGTVESVKAVSELYAPVSGTVTDVNGELATAGEKINEDPYGAWMIKVTLKDLLELKSLLSAAEYKKSVGRQKSTKNH